MRLVDYLDKGASIDPHAPCLTTDGSTMTYAEVQSLAQRIANALSAHGIHPGDKVAIISGNDPVAFTSVFGISRAGAIWCPINPRNEAAENRELLELFDCVAVIYATPYAQLVNAIRCDLPNVHTWVCLDESSTAGVEGAVSWAEFIDTAAGFANVDESAVDDVAMIVGTGGTSGRPKGVILLGKNLEAMTAITLMSYPFEPAPVYLALAPLTHAAGVLCFPILTHGGQIVIMRSADVGHFLELIERHHVTHTFLPPTVIYMVLAHGALERTDLTSLQCFWYGAAPMSVSKLIDAIHRIGPVMAQLFGQTEAPMMISTLAPADHFNADGSIATGRLASAGRPSPLTTVAIMAPGGALLPRGARGEIVVRGSLVMPGYYKNEEENRAASRFGWHHTGDVGYLDEENFLYVVDRAKDMIITGGFNVYSVEVEQAALSHPDIQDCAVIGMPDEKWGERVVAVIQARAGTAPDPNDVVAHIKSRIGSVKAPKEVLVWADLPRSKVGKVLKTEIRARLRHQT